MALGKHVIKFCKEHPKNSSSKVYDSIREKAPKTIGDNVYCAVYWYVLQDLCARIQDQDAAWLSNAGNLASVRMEPLLCVELLDQALSNSECILQNRIEYSSLIQYLVGYA